LKLRLKVLGSNSKPTKNKKNTKPKLAAAYKAGKEDAGKKISVNFGIFPKADGPNIIPPITSAMTLGCRSFASLNKKSMSLEKEIIRTAFKKKKKKERYLN